MVLKSGFPSNPSSTQFLESMEPPEPIESDPFPDTNLTVPSNVAMETDVIEEVQVSEL